MPYIMIWSFGVALSSVSHPLHLSKGSFTLSMYIIGPIHLFYLLLFIQSFLKLATSSDEYCQNAVDCLVVLLRCC